MFHLTCISLRTFREIPIPEETLLCLGNFDGVHIGHRSLLYSAKAYGDRELPDASVGVFTFRHYPSDSLCKDPPLHLSGTEERLERFAQCGMEFAILAEFEELHNCSPDDYIDRILKKECHAVGAACGFNHRFGKNGAGTPELLKEKFGGRVLLKEKVTVDGHTVSSTYIRSLLAEGKAEIAEQLLTLPYSLTAPVLHGKQLGRKIGSPTVNQNFPPLAVIPKFGVYATDVYVNGVRCRGVSNVGRHPTVDSNACANCETYLPDFSGDLYGETLRVDFRHFIRPEMKFDSVEALKNQISNDVGTVCRLLKDPEAD